jgi:hypothetical protein
MISSRYLSSRPHDSILPRPQLDAHDRLRFYGPVQPMERPGFLEKLFRKR